MPRQWATRRVRWLHPVGAARTCSRSRCWMRLREVRKCIEKWDVIGERIRRSLRLNRYLIPECLIAEQLDVVLFVVDLRVHVQEHRQKARRDLVLQSTTKRPGTGGVHVDRAH